mgnify:CR=1 FL=1
MTMTRQVLGIPDEISCCKNGGEGGGGVGVGSVIRISFIGLNFRWYLK